MPVNPMQISDKARDWLMVIPTGIVFFVLWPIVGQGKSFACAAIFYVFYAIISHRWDQRRDRRFWLVLLAFALVHVVALSLIRFPAEVRPGLISLPFALLDGFIMWAILDWIKQQYPRS